MIVLTPNGGAGVARAAYSSAASRASSAAPNPMSARTSGAVVPLARQICTQEEPPLSVSA